MLLLVLELLLQKLRNARRTTTHHLLLQMFNRTAATRDHRG